MASVIVIGGSLAGLQTAIILLNLGLKVTVLEKAQSVADGGSGIILGGDTITFLRQFDKDKVSLAVPITSRRYINRQDKQVGEEGRPQLSTCWIVLYNVLRANFDQPRNGVSNPNADYRLGCIVTDTVFDPEAQKMRVEYISDSAQKSLEADLVIIADGPSSQFRTKYTPQSKRVYAGYVGFRGSAVESELPEECKMLSGYFTNFLAGKNDGTGNTHFLCYVVPSPESLEKKDRLVYWAWYRNYRNRGLPLNGGRNTNEQKDLGEVLTDKNGVKHEWCVPKGLVSPEVVEDLSKHISDLPPSMQALVKATKEPLIQAITDVFPPTSKLIHENGHVIFVGDTVLGPRPHTSSSTNQGSLHALSLAAHLAGTTSLSSLLSLSEMSTPAKRAQVFAELETNLQKNWEKQLVAHARMIYATGKEIGTRQQFGIHPYNVDHERKSPTPEEEDRRVWSGAATVAY